MMVRPLDVSEPDHARRIVEIQRAAYTIEASLMGFDGIPQLHESELDVMRRTDLRWAGAWEEDLLVGVIASALDGPLVDIDRLAVDPGFSRRGHGRRLVQFACGDREAVVSTGAANAPARSLYESLGFTIEKSRPVAPGIEVVVLRRGSVQTEQPS